VSNSPTTSTTDADRPRGRRPSTSRADVARIALELFATRGFEATTMDDIAAAVGVSRRTLFRYYASKNDIVWGEFGGVMDALRAQLRAAPAEEELMTALRRAIVASNRYPADELPTLRIRMRLIGTVAALQGHSMLRYEEWARVVSEFAAERRGERPEDLVPRLVGSAALGTTMAAFQSWAEQGDGDPADTVDLALAHLAAGFGLPE
jgi:TetR/AcrR family transcriptional regulator, regulator of mycofactocin system